MKQDSGKLFWPLKRPIRESLCIVRVVSVNRVKNARFAPRVIRPSEEASIPPGWDDRKNNESPETTLSLTLESGVRAAMIAATEFPRGEGYR
ncbi:hypothetical protein OAF34_03220 [Pirellulaceae bacterium]|nr:hypothetical protein [Pirellulaceae bacterium]